MFIRAAAALGGWPLFLRHRPIQRKYAVKAAHGCAKKRDR